MKTILRLTLLIALVCAFVCPAMSQKRRRSTEARATDKPICAVDAIPKGFVVVSEKVSSQCGGQLELTIKKPGPAEVVCDGSPIPEGYQVMSQVASERCSTASRNPLANALKISGGDVVADARPTKKAPVVDDEDEDVPEIRVSITNDTKPARREPAIEQPAKEENRKAQVSVAQGPSREEIDTAIRRSTVVVGMNAQDVTRAWGGSHTRDRLVEDGQTIEIWAYRRGEVYFRDGIVYRAIILR